MAAPSSVNARTSGHMALQDLADTSVRTRSGTQQALPAAPLQMMKAYDTSEPLADPRHFSTHKIKTAIDACLLAGVPVPEWLREQVVNYLRNELSERHQDMARYGGGDAGHRHYFALIRDYVAKVESLPVADEALPSNAAAVQL